MRIITFANQKGGVGKTTSAVNVCAALSLRGFKCLLVDAEPQGDLSQSAGFGDLDETDITTYEVLKGQDINKAIHRREESSYDIVPADERLYSAEIELVDADRRNYLLKDALAQLKQPYDFVIIDSPPNLGILTIMALTAATEVIIPVQAQYLPLKGVARLRDLISLVESRFNPDLEISGVLITFYHANYNLDNDVKEALEQAFGTKVFNTKINTNSKVAEAPSYGVDVITYNSKSKGAQQYQALAGEIIGNETTEEG